MAELTGDDVDAFGAQLRGVRVAQVVGVDALLDASAGGEALEHHADVGVRYRATVYRAEVGLPTAQAEARPRVEPAFDDGGAGVQAYRA